MTLKNDAKFEEKLIFCLENDMRNLENFTKSKLITRCIILSSRNINLLIRNQVSAENIAIKVSALLTPS